MADNKATVRGVELDVTELYTGSGPYADSLYYADARPANPTTLDNDLYVRGGGQHTTASQMGIEQAQYQRIFIENVNATAYSLNWINSYSKKWSDVYSTNIDDSKLKTPQTPKSLSDKRVVMFNNTIDENYMTAALKSFNDSLEATSSNLGIAAPDASVPASTDPSARALRFVVPASTDPSARAPGLAARPTDLLRVTTAGLPAEAAPRPVVAARADAALAPTAPSAGATGPVATTNYGSGATGPVAPTNFQGGSSSFVKELIKFINNTKNYFDITKYYIADYVNKKTFPIAEGNFITIILEQVEKEIDIIKSTIFSKTNTLTTNDEIIVFNNLLQKTNNGFQASIGFYTSTDENKKYAGYDRVINFINETIDLANFSPRQKNSVKTIIDDVSNAYKNFEINRAREHRIESRKNNLNLINYLRHIFDTILKLTNLSSDQKIVAMSYLNDLSAIYYKFSNKTDLGFHFDLLSEIKTNENIENIIFTSLSLTDLPFSKKNAVLDILDDSCELLESLSTLF